LRFWVSLSTKSFICDILNIVDVLAIMTQVMKIRKNNPDLKLFQKIEKISKPMAPFFQGSSVFDYQNYFVSNDQLHIILCYGLIRKYTVYLTFLYFARRRV